jgi:hypothetical protein
MPKFLTSALFLFCSFFSSLQGQNSSLSFDGTDDYVLFPNCPGMTASSFTIEGWFKCQPSDIPQVILMSFLNLPDKNANVTLEVRETGLLRFNYRADAVELGGEDLISNSIVSNNQWHHFAAVKEGTDRLWLYIDGFPEVVSCGYFENISETPLFELGRNRYDPIINFRMFSGKMDDIKIWNRAKNCREIYTDHKNESAGSEFGIYGNYKFDITQDTVYDCSPNKKHGKRFGVAGINNLPQYATDVPPLNDVMCDFQLVGTEPELLTYKSEDLFIISPNPVTTSLEIRVMEAKSLNGQIYNSNGQLIQELEITGQFNKIDVSAFPAGVYLLKLNSSSRSKTASFIKT